MLVDWIGDRGIFPEAAPIAAPFMRERKIVAHHLDVLSHLLGHGPNHDRHADSGALHTLYFAHLLKEWFIDHWLVYLVIGLFDFLWRLLSPV